MSRLQSVVLTAAAITLAGFSFVPPWFEVVPIRGSVVTQPLKLWPLLKSPPSNIDSPYIRVDYGRLMLCYLGTIALVIPFFVWRRRSDA